MNEKDERLRALLREGDPAAGDPGLTRDEAGRMRRAVLAAVPEPRRRPVWLPVAAIGGGAAVAVLTLAIVLGPWRARTDLSVHEPTRRAAAAPVPAPPVPLPADAAPEAAPAAAPRETGETPAAPPRSRRARRAATPAPVRLASLPPPPALPEPALPSPAEESGEPGRQIQFSTPGGTRIIWVLSSKSVVE